MTRSESFLSFWKETLALLDTVPSAIEVKHRNVTGDFILERVSYQSLDNKLIEGYLLSPTPIQQKNISAPLIVYTHGYMSQCEVVLPWAKQGASVFGMDIRGCGRSKDAAPLLSEHGYILTGIDSQHTSILRGAVCDYIRGIQVAHELLQNQQQRTVLYGKSFGGALACSSAALTDYGDLLVAAVPTFSWMEGRRTLVTQGSGAEINAYIDKHPDQEPHVMHVLSYFDIMNFAPLIKCPALVGAGLQDPVVPPQTVFAFFNHLSCNKQLREFPVSHSSLPEENLWNVFEKEWLQRVLSGDF